MSRSDLSSLSPADGVVTLRSLPRRYREAFAGAKRRARAEVIGDGGVSAFDLLVDTVAGLGLLERALDQVDTSDVPVLHLGVIDRSQREFGSSSATSIDAALDDLEVVAASFADRVAAMSADAWTRTGAIAGRSGGDSTHVTALEVLQEAAATATDNLRAADALLAGP
jgi:hypothetical protein